MAWKKLDNDLAVADAPYSALLADGLTNNVNAYSSLNSGATITYDGDSLPMWAAWGQPTGTVVTLDVGVNCAEINFRTTYVTATNNADGSGFAGRLFVRHLTSAREVSVPVEPAVTATTVDISLVFDAVSSWPSGPQAFFISWQSAVLEDRGSVKARSGVNNGIQLWVAGSYSFTVGEKYEVLIIGGEKKYAVEETALGTYGYQIGYAAAPGGIPIFIVWPAVDYEPMIIPPPFDGMVSEIECRVYELGAFGLFSLEYETLGAPAVNERQLAHAPAYSLNSLSLQQTLAAADLRPDVGANFSEPFRLGYVLNAGDDISGVFAVQADTVGRLSLSFRAVRVDDSSDLADFSLQVLDETGAFITPEIISVRPAIPRMSYQNAVATSPISMRVVGGARRAGDGWGLRDSMPLTDCLKGTPMYLETAPFLLPGKGGVPQGDSVATFRLSVTGGEDLAFYLYGFNARFQ